MSLQTRLLQRFSLSDSTGFKITASHHVIFWLVYFVFNTLRWGSYYGDYLYSLKANILGFPIHMALCYFTVYLLIPVFIYRRKYLYFSLALVTAIYLMVLVKFYLTYLLINHNVWPEGPEVTSELSLNYLVVMMLGELYVISFVSAIKITIDWLNASKRAAGLEKLQSETELRFLRSQISPHFFFNTLNNIYSLSLEQSGKTSEIILKLSKLMRYLLYETKDHKQCLEREIDCIRNYLDLEKIRHGDKLHISLEISGETEEKKIAPMLLIPFIENAFKHGANKNLGKVNICICISVEGNMLHFRTSNTLPDAKFRKDAGPGGIGIANVRKRLELVYPEEDYSLDIFRNDQEHIVELKLKLR